MSGLVTLLYRAPGPSTSVAFALWVGLLATMAGSCKSRESRDPEPSAPILVEKDLVEKDAQEPKAQASTATAKATVTTKIPKKVVFDVDGKKVDVGKLGEDQEVLALPGLPPVKKWRSITAISVDGRKFHGMKPILLTGERSMRLRSQKGGGFRFAVTEEEGKSERHTMPTIARVVIETVDYEVPTPVAKAAVLVALGKETALEEIVSGLQKTPEPNEKEARMTWRLADFIPADTSPRAKVVMQGAEGEVLSLELSDVQDKEQMHVIKKSKRGPFHYRRWSLGEAPARTKELRSLGKIEVLLPSQ